MIKLKSRSNSPPVLRKTKKNQKDLHFYTDFHIINCLTVLVFLYSINHFSSVLMFLKLIDIALSP